MPDAVTTAGKTYAVWRAASDRACDRATPERDAYAAYMDAEHAAMRLAEEPAETIGDLAIKLRVFVEETRAGPSSIGDALLQATLADAERLAATSRTLNGKSGAEMARLYGVGPPTVSRIVAHHKAARA